MVTLSEYVIRNSVQRPLADIHHDVSSLQKNIFISETVHDKGKVSVEH